MKRGLKTFATGLICTSLIGCQSLQKQEGLDPSPQEKAAQRAELETAWGSLNEGKTDAALPAFQKFQADHPQSIFTAEAKLGEARALGDCGEWAKAAQIDRGLVVERLATQPAIAALALYDGAGAAEALGDEGQMLANLQDALTHQQDLPMEIRLAALPARLAVAYTKVSQPADALKARAQAEQGIAQLKAQNLPAGKWAELYFEMGSVSTNQISMENFQANLDSFAGAQIFLLKAIESGVRPWSLRALKSLQEHYRDFWNLAMNPEVPTGLDIGAKERMRAERQSRWLGEIAKLIALLKQNYKPEELKLSEDEKKMRQLVENLRVQTENHELEAASVLPLTPEARKRQGLRRSGVVRSAPLFPNEKAASAKASAAQAAPAPSPSEQKAPEDPNLKSGEGR